eukprot:TRINITY_DN5039_c0_g5_i1.p1 TRINITY_DN5039_c0_g5~~TRINITY_DN5039_c0_g5_i1.p1  ORF type:complete len:432 (-),score=78.81 TRINITY_DN5039_c0_g5_i1:107-1402(-)
MCIRDRRRVHGIYKMLNRILGRNLGFLRRALWDKVQPAEMDSIITFQEKFKEDKDPQKVSLVRGVYRTNEEKPYLFKCVELAEKRMANSHLDKEYLPVDGEQNFVKAAKRLVFGDDFNTEKVATVQTLSGTGAVNLGLNFLYRFLPPETGYYIPDPSWPLHFSIAKEVGLRNIFTYPYYDNKKVALNFDGIKAKLLTLKPKSVVILHACAHNPTGIDPTPVQWKAIIDIVKEKKLLPFLDMAYQGFATGDFDRDASAVRLFAKEDVEMLVAQSFAKNAGLYGERIGALHFLCKSESVVKPILSQLKVMIRTSYSSNPMHGAKIVAQICENKELFEMWKEELKTVSGRIQEMRVQLSQKLGLLKTPGNWDHIRKQIGMFSYTGLTPSQCQKLIDKHHVYLLNNGRISITGINLKNIDYIAKSIHDVVINPQT